MFALDSTREANRCLWPCAPRAAIAKLRQDNAKLKEELLLENKFSVTPTSSNLSANIANLQDQSDVYTRKVSFASLPKARCTPAALRKCGTVLSPAFLTLPAACALHCSCEAMITPPGFNASPMLDGLQ